MSVGKNSVVRRYHNQPAHKNLNVSAWHAAKQENHEKFIGKNFEKFIKRNRVATDKRTK